MKKLTFQVLMTFVFVIVLTMVSFSFLKNSIIQQALKERQAECAELGDKVNELINISLANNCDCYLDEKYIADGVVCSCDCKVENITSSKCATLTGCYVDSSSDDCRCIYPISVV